MSLDTLPVRRNDPDSSYEAAVQAVMRSSKVRPVVLEILRQAGQPMTHDEIIAQYRFRTVTVQDTPKASDSGIRTRTKELVRAGLVRRAHDKGRSIFNNTALRWEAVPEDDVVGSTAASNTVPAGSAGTPTGGPGANAEDHQSLDLDVMAAADAVEVIAATEDAR